MKRRAKPDAPAQPSSDRLVQLFDSIPADRRGAFLEWLERQTEPELEATDAETRRIGVAYVPPNDAKGKIEVLPERRGKQPRFFPAAIPQQPVVKLSWPGAAPDGPTLDALEALALVGGGAFLPVHWSTFALAMHPWDEPAETLVQLAPAQGVHLVMPMLGEAVEPAAVDGVRPWWRGVDKRAASPVVEVLSWPRAVPFPLD